MPEDLQQNNETTSSDRAPESDNASIANEAPEPLAEKQPINNTQEQQAAMKLATLKQAGSGTQGQRQNFRVEVRPRKQDRQETRAQIRSMTRQLVHSANFLLGVQNIVLKDSGCRKDREITRLIRQNAGFWRDMAQEDDYRDHESDAAEESA